MAPGALSPQGGEPAGPISPTPSPSADVGAAAMLPTSALVPPPSTRSPTPSQGTDQPPPPITPGDAAQFGAYVLDHYGVIAGQPMEIAVVSVDTTEAGQPEVVVEVVGSDASNVFAAQTAAAALDYGRRLLDDTKLYSGGQSCAVKVVSSYDTSYPDLCRSNPSWCTVGERDQSNSKWSIAWTYVLGTSTDAADSVETWNTGQ